MIIKMTMNIRRLTANGLSDRGIVMVFFPWFRIDRGSFDEWANGFMPLEISEHLTPYTAN